MVTMVHQELPNGHRPVSMAPLQSAYHPARTNSRTRVHLIMSLSSLKSIPWVSRPCRTIFKPHPWRYLQPHPSLFLPLCLHSSHTNSFWFYTSAMLSSVPEPLLGNAFSIPCHFYPLLTLPIHHWNLKHHLPWEDLLSPPTPTPTAPSSSYSIPCRLYHATLQIMNVLVLPLVGAGGQR